MATRTTEETSITAQEIIALLKPYYFQLSQEQDIAFLKLVICLGDTLQIIKYVSEDGSKGSSALLEDQLSKVDTETFDKTVLALKNGKNYLRVEGHKANSKEQDVIIFVEIPEDKAERRDVVAEIIRSLFSKRGYVCPIG